MYHSEAQVKTVPADRVVTPEVVAKAALFLADPVSEFVNGKSLIIADGAFRGSWPGHAFFPPRPAFNRSRSFFELMR
jgi:hypothetical protein